MEPALRNLTGSLHSHIWIKFPMDRLCDCQGSFSIGHIDQDILRMVCLVHRSVELCFSELCRGAGGFLFFSEFVNSGRVFVRVSCIDCAVTECGVFDLHAVCGIAGTDMGTERSSACCRTCVWFRIVGPGEARDGCGKCSLVS